MNAKISAPNFGTLEPKGELSTGLDDLISLDELARKTAFSRIYWYKRVSSKRLPFAVYRFGRSVRFKLADVLAWIEAHKAKVTLCR